MLCLVKSLVYLFLKMAKKIVFFKTKISCVKKNSPYKKLHFLCGQECCPPPPLTDMSAKNVSFFTAPLR